MLATQFIYTPHNIADEPLTYVEPHSSHMKTIKSQRRTEAVAYINHASTCSASLAATCIVDRSTILYM